MKSTPHVPGMLVDPNSAPDSSTPSHFHPRLPVDEVVVAFVVLVVNVVPVALDVVVVAAVPGMH